MSVRTLLGPARISLHFAVFVYPRAFRICVFRELRNCTSRAFIQFESSTRSVDERISLHICALQSLSGSDRGSVYSYLSAFGFRLFCPVLKRAVIVFILLVNTRD